MAPSSRSRFSTAPISRLRSPSCSTRAPAWRAGWRRRRKPRSGSCGACAAGPGPGDRLRQPRAGHPGLHEQRGDLEGAIRRTNAGGLDVTAQRDLHRAERAEADAGARHRRDPPAGHRRALRRRRHVEPGQLRRGAGSRQALGDGHLRDRPALTRRAEPRVQRCGVRAAPADPTDRRARVLHTRDRRARDRLRANRRRVVEPVHAGLHIAQSQAGRRMAADRGAYLRTERLGAGETGVYAPTS